MLAVLSLFVLSFFCPLDAEQYKQKRIVIVSAGYNNKKWYKRNLDSVFMQKYDNWHLLYTDDGSPDGTGDLVESYVKEQGFQSKVTLVKNIKRIGSPLANIYRSIMSCDDRDIIAVLDGDDFFADDRVLAYLNQVYQDESIWLTYGQYVEASSGRVGFSVPYPQHIISTNNYRDFTHIPSHLRSFYAGLFKKIRYEDLLYNGEFIKAAGDVAFMMPMMEMAGPHHKFISRIMTIYNDLNELNEHKVDKAFQRKMDLLVRGRPRYSQIVSPFLKNNEESRR